MCGVQLKNRKRSTDFMFMLGLNKTIDQLTMINSVCWHGHILRRALNFEVEGQRKKGRPKRTWKRQVEEESVEESGWIEKERCTLPIKVECRCKQNCCWVEVNLATLTCWRYKQIVNIGVSLSLFVMILLIYIYIYISKQRLNK